MSEHPWTEGTWEAHDDRYERVDKCLACGCYRVAIKDKLTDTTCRIRYYPPDWTGKEAERCRQKPDCMEPVKQEEV